MNLNDSFPAPDAVPDAGALTRAQARQAAGTCDVFVYGTLRHGEINDIALAAARFGRPEIPGPRHIATLRVPGRLVDFGDWPGFVPTDDVAGDVVSMNQAFGDATVVGDVFRIDLALLPILDEIEGIRRDGRDAFYRSEIDLPLMGGVSRGFYYPIDIAAGQGLPTISGGDWVAYRLSRGH